MVRKLLKRITVCAMTAAMCVGMLVPMQAQAAKESDVVGTWSNIYNSDMWVTFNPDGTAPDMFDDTHYYYMEPGNITVTYRDYSGQYRTENISYDLWDGMMAGGGAPDSFETADYRNVYQLVGDNYMRSWNLFWGTDADGNARLYAYYNEKMGDGRYRGGSGKKSREEIEAEKKEAAELEAMRKAMEQASRESVRLEGQAADEGFVNGAQMQDAQSMGMSSGEYYNNAVVTTEGIENAVPVGQGGKLVIEGRETNVCATLSKAPLFVDSVCKAKEGTLLNVVDVQFPAKEAIVNFYMPGIVVTDAIAAAQYVDGAWTDVEVVEVRADHVVLNLKSNGVVAFLKK